MAELTVQVCTHHFVVRGISARGRPAVESFARRYVQYGWVRERGRSFRAALRVFAAATQARTEYRFHINTLKDFRAHLELPEYLLKDALVEWIEVQRPLYRKVELPVFPQWETREDQVPVVEYIKNVGPPRSKFVDLQTGKGKSYCSLRAISDLGVLPCIVVRPMYLEKWLIDIRKTYDIELEEVMMVQGSKQLQALLLLAEEDQLDDIKVILMSNKTLQNWIKLYEQHGDYTLEMGYACTPEKLFEKIGAGFRLIDEVHQDFHLNFKIDLYTNVEHSTSLSATLLSDDDFLNKMYELAYPAATRYKGGPYDKYIDARAVMYKAAQPNKLRTSEYGSKTYSHHAFEKSIMRNPVMLKNYLNQIKLVLDGTYMRTFQPGYKGLVYVASIEFATIVTNFLKQQYPRHTVCRYVEDDPYDNLMEPDLRVTTLLSAGTGVDIPGLTTVVLTVAVASSQSNIQGFGRLRKPKDGAFVPIFLYFVCEDIKKHIEYHERKRVLLEERALSYKAEWIPQPI